MTPTRVAEAVDSPPGPMVRVVVRGIGDIGSAVAHGLFGEGYAVVIHDVPAPTTTRRGMAFTDAVFDGRVALDGVEAIRADDLSALMSAINAQDHVPVFVGDYIALIRGVRPDVLIDARMRKREKPESQRGLAALTIGLGPNFVAGETTDVLIETRWGERLGQVVTEGASLPFAGEPRLLGGHGRDRYVYAPDQGAFRTTRDIGDPVKRGNEVARIGSMTLPSPLDGVLRGLTRDGVHVPVGTKVIEVDPRGALAEVRGIGERPRRVGQGVLSAVRRWRGV